MVMIAIGSIWAALSNHPLIFVPSMIGFAGLCGVLITGRPWTPTLLRGLSWTMPPTWFFWLAFSLATLTTCSALVFRLHGLRVVNSRAIPGSQI
jgi:hypothetical protein